MKVKVKVSQSSNSLGPRGLYSPWTSLGQNTGVGSLFLLQGTVPTQGLNPGLPHCRQILYQLSHKGSPSVEGDAFTGSFLRSSPSSDSLCGKDHSEEWLEGTGKHSLVPGWGSVIRTGPSTPRDSPNSASCPTSPLDPMGTWGIPKETPPHLFRRWGGWDLRSFELFSGPGSLGPIRIGTAWSFVLLEEWDPVDGTWGLRSSCLGARAWQWG